MILGQMMNYPLTLDQILKRANRMTSFQKIIARTASDGPSFQEITYAEHYQNTCRLAHVLKKLGVQSGDRVGTLAWNTLQHLGLYFAVPCVGAVLHTLNLRLSADQLAYIIHHAQDKVIFCDASLVSLLEHAASHSPHHFAHVEKIVVIGASSSFQTSLGQILHYEELLQAESGSFDWPDLNENLAAGLCYTSGTTGNPKGALYSHRSHFLHAMAISMADSLGLRSTDTVMPIVPMFHASAWGLPYGALMVGAKLVLPGPRFTPEDLALMIQSCKVTYAAAVPTLWAGIYQAWKSGRYDLSSLRAIAVGGSAMPRVLIEAFEREMKVSVLHLWGMTETSPLGTCSGSVDFRTDLNSNEKIQLKSTQGFAVPCIEMRVIGGDGTEQPWDGKSTGELQVRGPWVISSYFSDGGGSSQFTSDGWFRTGDVATIDSYGNMTIMDRIKDLIKSGGEWISSIALENALLGCTGVREAAVIAVPDDKWGERPVALIVPRDGANVCFEEIKKELSKQFVKFWIPERIMRVNEIPKTSVGKTDKKTLRALHT